MRQFSDISNRVVVAGFTENSAYSNEQMEAIFAHAYEVSNGFGTAVDEWLADPENHGLTIDLSFRLADAEGPAFALTGGGVIFIDPDAADDLIYIRADGVAVSNSVLSIIVHEAGHAFAGDRDNVSYSDLRGDNLRNNADAWYQELGIPIPLSYVAQSYRNGVLEVDRDYSLGYSLHTGIVDEVQNRGVSVDTINTDFLANSVVGPVLYVGSNNDNSIVGSGLGDVIHGGGGADQLDGGGGADTLVGDEGGDTFVGGLGNDIIWGGEIEEREFSSTEVDEVDYSSSSAPITVNYSEDAGTPQISVQDGEGGTDTLHSIERIIGTSGFDIVRISSAITQTGLTIDGGGGQGGGGVQKGEDVLNASSLGVGVTIAIDSQGNGSIVTATGGGSINLVNFNTQIIASGHDDTITDFSPGDKRIGGGAGDDTISTEQSTGDVKLIGGRGDDTLTGGSGDDVIIGDWSDQNSFDRKNFLNGGGGNDYILSTSWRDVIDGGDGDDYIDIAYQTDVSHVSEVIVKGGAGDDYIDVAGRLSKVDVILGPDSGKDLVNYQKWGFHNGALSSTINVVLEGVEPEDITLIWDGPNDGNNHFGNLAVVVNSTGASLYLPNIWGSHPSENPLSSSFAALAITINNTHPRFSGANFMFGSTDQYFVDPQAFQDATQPDPEDTQGSGDDDHLEGGEGDDDINAGDGDDTISNTGGDDTVDGGAGNDTLFAFGSFGNYTVTGNATSATLTDLNGLEGQTTLTSVEYVVFVGDAETYAIEELVGYFGTSNPDEITASNRDNEIFGLQGDDTIFALAGDDVIAGGEGNDVIDGGEGQDRAVYSGNSTDYEVLRQADGRVLINAVSTNGLEGDDTLTGVESVIFDGDGASIEIADLPINGTESADNIVGTDDDDTIIAFGGDDTIEGGIGFDDIDGGTGYDTAQFSGASDEYSISYNTDGDIEVSALSGGGGFVVLDGDGTDVLRNVEALYFAGDDTTILASQIPPLGTSGNDTITGTERIDILYGLDGDDLLIGLENDDRLDGGAGSDTMHGGLGDDTYFVDNAGDIVVEGANQGNDLVVSQINFVLPDNVEGLILAGVPFGTPQATSGTGNELANEIFGNDGDNTLTGLEGDDLFEGSGGDDTIYGGDGVDTARYGDVVSNYEIIRRQDGTVTVTSLSGSGGPGGPGDPFGGGSPILGPPLDEGSDTLSNVEFLEFVGDPFSGGTVTIAVADLPIDQGGQMSAAASSTVQLNQPLSYQAFIGDMHALNQPDIATLPFDSVSPANRWIIDRHATVATTRFGEDESTTKMASDVSFFYRPEPVATANLSVGIRNNSFEELVAPREDAVSIQGEPTLADIFDRLRDSDGVAMTRLFDQLSESRQHSIDELVTWEREVASTDRWGEHGHRNSNPASTYFAMFASTTDRSFAHHLGSDEFIAFVEPTHESESSELDNEGSTQDQDSKRAHVMPPTTEAVAASSLDFRPMANEANDLVSEKLARIRQDMAAFGATGREGEIGMRSRQNEIMEFFA